MHRRVRVDSHAHIVCHVCGDETRMRAAWLICTGVQRMRTDTLRAVGKWLSCDMWIETHRDDEACTVFVYSLLLAASMRVRVTR